MRILVTGAGGLLGSKITEYIQNHGHQTYACYLSHQPLFGHSIKLDITNKHQVEEVFDRIHPDKVIHCAALTDLDLCEKEPHLADTINVRATQHIIKATQTRDAHLIYISTDYVFDGRKGQYTESDTPNPINHYGRTKLEAEKSVLSSPIHGLVIRPSVIYGSQPAGGKKNFALWILNKLQQQETLNILIDQYVSPTLNTNLASMILESVEKELTGLYHMAGSSRVSRYEFASTLAQEFGYNTNLIKQARMVQMKWRAARPVDSSLDISKAIQTLQQKPLKLQESIRRLKEELQDASRNNNQTFTTIR